MDLKQKRILIYILLAVTLALALLANFTFGGLQTACIAATVVMIFAVLACWIGLWRCPYCRKFLQGLNAKRCRCCGRDLRR